MNLREWAFRGKHFELRLTLFPKKSAQNCNQCGSGSSGEYGCKAVLSHPRESTGALEGTYKVMGATYKSTSVVEDNYSAVSVAKYIVRYCIEHNEYISNIKMQKLLYLVYGFFLNMTGLRLFPEKFEAWQYGPVVEEVYRAFCYWGGADILVSKDDPETAKFPDDHKGKVDGILERYYELGTFTLVEDTHTQGYAWDKAMSRNQGVYHHEIELGDIQDEFAEREKRLSSSKRQ